jgi:ElaB/YqjD/DUF883 family membrane-anchored ribosome-binding protein
MDNLPDKGQKTLTEIQRRREQLKAELAKIEQDLEGNIDEIKSGIQQKTNPKHWIRKHPIASVGIAVAIGMLIGSSRKAKSTSGGGSLSSNSFASELKRVALSRGINAAVAGLEQYLAQRMSASQEDPNS